MSGECECCGEHAVDCQCRQNAEIYEMFLGFLVDAVNEFFPDQSKKVTNQKAVKFINEWLDKRLKIIEEE